MRLMRLMRLSGTVTSIRSGQGVDGEDTARRRNVPSNASRVTLRAGFSTLAHTHLSVGQGLFAQTSSALRNVCKTSLAVRGKGAIEYTVAACAIRSRLAFLPGGQTRFELTNALFGRSSRLFAHVLVSHHDALAIRAEHVPLPPYVHARGQRHFLASTWLMVQARFANRSDVRERARRRETPGNDGVATGLGLAQGTMDFSGMRTTSDRISFSRMACEVSVLAFAVLSCSAKSVDSGDDAARTSESTSTTDEAGGDVSTSEAGTSTSSSGTSDGTGTSSESTAMADDGSGGPSTGTETQPSDGDTSSDTGPASEESSGTANTETSSGESSSGGPGPACTGSHPIVDGEMRYCERGDCYCADFEARPVIEFCFPADIAEPCCPVDVVCY